MLTWLVGLVDDGNAVRVLVSPSVDTVVGSVKTTLVEPSYIAVLEATGADGLERNIPVNDLVGNLAKELVGVVDRLGVVSCVLFGIDVRSRTPVIAQKAGGNIVGLDLGNVSFSHLVVFGYGLKTR